jgi:hypothetical protein
MGDDHQERRPAAQAIKRADAALFSRLAGHVSTPSVVKDCQLLSGGLSGVTVTQDLSETAMIGDPVTARLPRWYRDRPGGIAVLIYLGLVLFYEHGAIGHLGSVCACQSAADPTQWMWSWAWIGHAIFHLQNPLYTNLIWTPQPFDLAATTLAPITAIPGVPLEALFGPVAAYNVLTLAAPLVNGWAAYRLCRYLSGATWASVLAGYTYGFSAYELDQMLGHLHLIYVFVPPLVVLVVLRYMNQEVSARRTAVFLAVLLVIQFGLSSEMLFDFSFVGVVAVVLGVVFAGDQRPRLLRAVGLLVIGYAVMGVIWAYYIHVEFKVPSYAKNAGLSYPGDLMSYVVPTPVFKIGGNHFFPLSQEFYAASDTSEQNQYLGLPLVLIVFAVGCEAWRRRTTKIVLLTTFFAFLVTLGTPIYILGHGTWAGLYNQLLKLPDFNLILPTRVGVFVALGAAICLALFIAAATDRRSRIWRWVIGLVAAAFLIPNLHFPERVGSFAVPRFFTTSSYKRYLKPNEVVLTIPFSNNGFDMLWQADAHLYFKLAGGYFGVPTPQYTALPLTNELMTNTPSATAPSDLRSFADTFHVGAIVVQNGQAGPWLPILAKAGWRLEANTGGVSVYKHLAVTPSESITTPKRTARATVPKHAAQVAAPKHTAKVTAPKRVGGRR